MFVRRARAISLIVAAACAASALASAAEKPTDENINRKKVEAEELKKQFEASQQKLTDEQRRLDELGMKAGEALEVLDTATREAEQADRDLWNAREQLQIAEKQSKTTKIRLSRWAASTYRQGALSGDALSKLAALSSSNTAEIARDAATLERVGTTRAQLNERADAAERLREQAKETAKVSAAKATRARAQAAQAKVVADKALAEHQAYVATLRAESLRIQGAAALAQEEAGRLEEAKRIADDAFRQAQLNNPGGMQNMIVGQVGACKGAPIAQYANGRIPREALCPLWGKPNHRLRADAAHAFGLMSQAYARQFGKPICITDSYRPYEVQVTLKIRKPRLAARPGTSNHGWARATDLCGGINNFGTVPHRWMRANAPLYGWYHPAWARINGSKPEAWHWEFSGVSTGRVTQVVNQVAPGQPAVPGTQTQPRKFGVPANPVRRP